MQKSSVFDLIKSPKRTIGNNFTLLKFALVGASGVVVNLLVLSLLKRLFEASALTSPFVAVIAANGIAVELSILNNFVWNDRFTFRDRRSANHNAAKLNAINRLGKYNLLSLSTFAINMTVFTLLQLVGVWYIWSSLVAIVSAFSVNYLGSAKWAWKHNTSEAPKNIAKHQTVKD